MGLIKQVLLYIYMYSIPVPRSTGLIDLVFKRPSSDCMDLYCRDQAGCRLSIYPYGWGLHASNTGCCGNYNGCCKLASVVCYIHDVMCDCCGSIFCGPQCKKDPACDDAKTLADEAVGGSDDAKMLPDDVGGGNDRAKMLAEDADSGSDDAKMLANDADSGSNDAKMLADDADSGSGDEE
ncbi:hypothetical protein SNE40_006062 [Patella caerulea]|uniref:Uncharacterized protein n=1 Tax=Patella caerulea TaxID=87958 RepID=A0AAN8K1M3_PATCE